MPPVEPHPRSSLTRVHPFILVVVGGGLGSLVRHGIVSASSSVTTAVFFLNVVGSLLLGAMTAWVQQPASNGQNTNHDRRSRWSALGGVGFCGGLTTFSTHMVDVAQRLDSSPSSAIVPLAVTAALAIVAAAVGFEVTRRQVSIAHESTRGQP